MKEIYILHEYYTPSHFFALYDQEKNQNEYKIKDYIIISHKNLLKYHIKEFLKHRKFIKFLKNYLQGLKKIFCLKKISKKTLIVGIAPYNKLMKKYEQVFEKNNTIYFTSFTHWSNERVKVHSGMSRNQFLEVINKKMNAIAGVSKKTLEELKPFISDRVKYCEVNHSIQVNNYLKKNIKNLNYKESGHLKILYLGQFIRRKNVNVLLKWLKVTEVEIEVHFAGKGELEPELREGEKTFSNIKVLGQLSKKKIKEKLREYDYLILPSSDEPFGIVLLEALAAGVPCITSDASGPKEIIVNEKNGYILEGEINPKALEALIKRIDLLSIDEYRSLVNNSILSSERYKSYNILKKWKELI